ncbi:hypothetical protein [Agromyces atrinae]|uniref:Uncharacterized protein n=1 Tax=Agromyces atrinae TaxID=592376 RepID=A0A4V1R204_9MICO|nr:hypothetical protein [Agromyces atrinae]NYD65668.1 hypothetical protein [Agromyces atrinae]RXZ85466.1 hypothetical protein ESP50_14775 [Agromyces atrinae]
MSPVPVVNEYSGEQLFDLVNSRLADIIGVHGQWTLVRRTDDDTDEIFHAMLTHQIAAELTHAYLADRSAQRVAAGAEPLALGWTPAPLVVHTDAADREPDIAPVAGFPQTPIHSAA